MKTIKKRAPGGGRKPLPEEQRRVSRSVSISQATAAYLAGRVADGARSPGHAIDALVAALDS